MNDEERYHVSMFLGLTGIICGLVAMALSIINMV